MGPYRGAGRVVARAAAGLPLILVVEDDPDIRETLAEILRDHGYQVACAPNGLDALGRLEAAPTPAAIILDLVMPVMDGWRFRAAQLGDPRFAEIPVIVTSASANKSSVPGGAATFLPKPVQLDQLFAAIERCVTRCAPEP
ncbi:MAG: response regulator [Deltaproteobacteria bacterium]|nr:response regulator [Deltaproteobacteria bacterium]